jgi:hypothetical protein
LHSFSLGSITITSRGPRVGDLEILESTPNTFKIHEYSLLTQIPKSRIPLTSMIDESSMAKQRTDLTGASPASTFAFRAATIRHFHHRKQSTNASSSLCHKEKERGVVESLAELH